ncbi:hypothetical protein D9611_010720 [Ephemerocybe angulata]|uniref:Uncharacterized protein n=1 Tax=Ephemerocybe angulata TaxID=980116 RepID=A0A8H5F1R9_9AGAR|nr:hypothetical protein D9611_010720 [Tulosesus angulatus]
MRASEIHKRLGCRCGKATLPASRWSSGITACEEDVEDRAWKLMRLLPDFIAKRPYVAEHDFSGVVVNANGTAGFKATKYTGGFKHLLKCRFFLPLLVVPVPILVAQRVLRKKIPLLTQIPQKDHSVGKNSIKRPHRARRHNQSKMASRR